MNIKIDTRMKFVLCAIGVVSLGSWVLNLKICRNVILMLKYDTRYITRRSLHSVRVRFAPSPTGYLHLGGLRTALYNYLFAKKHNGIFILRIEDTDRTRIVDDATDSIMKDLKWAGIGIDEGPVVGGNYGPYIQSQRVHLYNNAVQQLIETKHAYRCFCSETRLDTLRKEALKLRQVPRYDNKCRNISLSEEESKMKNGTPFCIRFKMTEYSDNERDLIYGNNFNNSGDNEGDPVIIKSDGFPTYHFANVVDDHLMGITHVFRGVEWQISTIKHLLLYKAFGWDPPKYGHLPLLINADGTKLSKRQGNINIKQYRDQGILPLALVNYVVSAGGGFHKEELSIKPTIQSINELSKNFFIEKLNSHPSKLNPTLLDEFNYLEIQRRLSDEKETDNLVEIVRNMVISSYPQKNIKDLNAPYIRKVLKWSEKRLTTLSDLTSKKLSFLWIDGDMVHTKDLTRDQILHLITSLERIEFTKENIHAVLKEYSKNASIKFPVLMQTLRSCLSGLKDGPGVAEIMEIFGRDDSLKRIRSNLISKKE